MVFVKKGNAICYKRSLNHIDRDIFLKLIDTNDLQVDSSYQRTEFISSKIVKEISSSFSEVLCGALIVAERKDGTYWVVDGNHRFQGAKNCGKELLTCLVFDSDGPAHEARIFCELNKKRTGINAVSMFKASLKQLNKESIEIAEVLDIYKMSIGNGGIRVFKAAVAISEVYKKGVLEDVIRTIDISFDNGSSVRWSKMFSQSHFIQSLGLIYSNKAWNISMSRLCSVLTNMHEDEYQRLASKFSGATGGRATKIAPEIISGYYNKGLRSSRVKV